MRRALIAACLLPCLFASTASARGIAVSGPPQRDVRMLAGVGELTLVLVNEGETSVVPAFEFARSDGTDVSAVTSRTASGSAMELADPGSALKPLPAEGRRRVTVILHTGRDHPVEDADGTLSVTPGDATVEVRGRGPDLRFDPPKISLAISQACWRLLTRCGETSEVVVRGEDALRWASQPGGPLGSAILHNARGGTMRVGLELQRPIVRNGTVVARVRARRLSAVGSYAGAVPIDAEAFDGVDLQVDAKVRWSLGSAIAAVFAGALVGGFFLKRFEIRRRRRLLELELLSALSRYDEFREPDRVYSYDLDSMLEPRHSEVQPFPGSRGVSALLWHIRNATDDDDFAEDIDRTHALIANIERWIALEPVSRDAARLLEEAQPGPRHLPAGTTAFRECRSYRDLALLRIRATRMPVDDRDVQKLIEELIAQCLIVSKSKVIWALLKELEERDGVSLEHGRVMHAYELTELEAGFPRLRDRTPEQSEELRLTLDDAEARLRQLHAGADTAVTEAEPARQAREIERELADKRRLPSLARTHTDVSARRLQLQAVMNRLALRSVLWTLARALVAVAGYTLLIYNDTWGTETDFASAFTTGFLTETIVNWALLPAFRSIRSRSATRTQPAAPLHLIREPEVIGSGSDNQLVERKP